MRSLDCPPTKNDLGGILVIITLDYAEIYLDYAGIALVLPSIFLVWEQKKCNTKKDLFTRVNRKSSC